MQRSTNNFEILCKYVRFIKMNCDLALNALAHTANPKVTEA